MPQIFFHVGLGKTASTWLQNKVFPHFKGITYLHPTRYRHWQSTIAGDTNGIVLISREMDQQLERETRKFAAVYPDAIPIIVMRTNAQWIASQYRRFLKNGYTYTFREFFDVEHNTGFWKREDVILYPKIEILKQIFTREPIVVLYDDLRNDPKGFIAMLANQMHVEADMSSISFDAHHASYSEKQLKWMLYIGRFIFSKRIMDPTQPKWKIWLHRRPRMWLCYLVLYSAKLIPAIWLSKKPLISKEEIAAVDAYYKSDWDKVLQSVTCRPQ